MRGRGETRGATALHRQPGRRPQSSRPLQGRHPHQCSRQTGYESSANVPDQIQEQHNPDRPDRRSHAKPRPALTRRLGDRPCRSRSRASVVRPCEGSPQPHARSSSRRALARDPSMPIGTRPTPRHNDVRCVLAFGRGHGDVLGTLRHLGVRLPLVVGTASAQTLPDTVRAQVRQWWRPGTISGMSDESARHGIMTPARAMVMAAGWIGAGLLLRASAFASSPASRSTGVKP